MNAMIGILSFGLLAASLPGAPGQQVGAIDSVTGRLNQAIVEFNQSHDPKELLSIFDEASRLQAFDVKPGALRTFKINSMLRLLSVVEAEVDPAFSLDRPPTRSVLPPPGDYPPKVAPSAIKDESVRKKYEAAIAENNKKIERFNYQINVDRTRQYMISGITEYVDRHYDDSKASLAEVTNYLRQYRINRASQERILASFKTGNR